MLPSVYILLSGIMGLVRVMVSVMVIKVMVVVVISKTAKIVVNIQEQTLVNIYFFFIKKMYC